MKGPVGLLSPAVSMTVKRFAGPEAGRGHKRCFVLYQLQILVTCVS